MNDDTIKRSDVIDAVIKAEIRASIYYKPNWDMVKKIIADIPSADRPSGTYTNSEENVEWYATEATCNLCGEPWMGARNFCPNCGAKMKGANDEIS